MLMLMVVVMRMDALLQSIQNFGDIELDSIIFPYFVTLPRWITKKEAYQCHKQMKAQATLALIHQCPGLTEWVRKRKMTY
jgi:hypothetical protein